MKQNKTFFCVGARAEGGLFRGEFFKKCFVLCYICFRNYIFLATNVANEANVDGKNKFFVFSADTPVAQDWAAC